MSTKNPKAAQTELPRFRGVVVPMLSPFTAEHAVDEPAVARIVERLLSGGVAGIFPLGTTGESASIPQADKRRLVAATVRAVGDRATVYAGISGNVFRESVELAKASRDLGAQAVVAHAPSYYGLSEGEIEAYFERLADAVPLPLVLYNIPQTTHMNIPLDAVMRLSKHTNIVAIKDSANDAARLTDLLTRTGGRGGFPVLLGCSAQFTHGLRLGGVGLIPSGAHLVPTEYQEMFEAAMELRWADVERLQHVTDEACGAYLKGRSIGQGLAALKAILDSQGICGRTMLPPLIDAPTLKPARVETAA
jgi:4-hydroxy-tetrahydrodipicolinate synthase